MRAYDDDNLHYHQRSCSYSHEGECMCYCCTSGCDHDPVEVACDLPDCERLAQLRRRAAYERERMAYAPRPTNELLEDLPF